MHVEQSSVQPALLSPSFPFVSASSFASKMFDLRTVGPPGRGRGPGFGTGLLTGLPDMLYSGSIAAVCCFKVWVLVECILRDVCGCRI